jgi:hypothetical protein
MKSLDEFSLDVGVNHVSTYLAWTLKSNHITKKIPMSFYVYELVVQYDNLQV